MVVTVLICLEIYGKGLLDWIIQLQLIIYNIQVPETGRKWLRRAASLKVDADIPEEATQENKEVNILFIMIRIYFITVEKHLFCHWFVLSTWSKSTVLADKLTQTIHESFDIKTKYVLVNTFLTGNDII